MQLCRRLLLAGNAQQALPAQCLRDMRVKCVLNLAGLALGALLPSLFLFSIPSHRNCTGAATSISEHTSCFAWGLPKAVPLGFLCCRQYMQLRGWLVQQLQPGCMPFMLLQVLQAVSSGHALRTDVRRLLTSASHAAMIRHALSLSPHQQDV